MANHLLQPDAAVLDHAVAIRPVVEIAGGVIRSIHSTPDRVPGGTGNRLEALRGTLLPGFVDLQVNGAGGRGCDEVSAEALDTVARTVAENGAAAFLPTVITAPVDRLVQQLAAIADWIEDGPHGGAVPLGIHVEGPFLSNAGAHDPGAMVDPEPELVDRILAAGRGQVRLVTLSPSRRGAAAAVSRLCSAGVTVALGHGSGREGIAECVAAGATMATHLFNAMGNGDHRTPGMADAIMDEAALSCSLIMDNIHVHPMRVRLTTATIGVHRTVLVSDCVSAMGMPDGEYTLAGIPVTLREGAVRNKDGTLAGSALTMFDAVRNFRAAVPTAGPWTLSRVAATNPARLIGEQRFGRIREGCAARFALLGEDGALSALSFC